MKKFYVGGALNTHLPSRQLSGRVKRASFVRSKGVKLVHEIRIGCNATITNVPVPMEVEDEEPGHQKRRRKLAVLPWMRHPVAYS